MQLKVDDNCRSRCKSLHHNPSVCDDLTPLDDQEAKPQRRNRSRRRRNRLPEERQPGNQATGSPSVPSSSEHSE